MQPGTPVERRLIDQGYLKAGYNPLTLNPFQLKRLLYNPPPLGNLIARAYLDALAAGDKASEYIGRSTMELLATRLAPETIATRPASTEAEAETLLVPAAGD